MRRIVVQAQDDAGQTVWDAELAHGADPTQVLSTAGWRPRWLGARTEGHCTVLRYAVQPAQVPVPHQRLATYAVVLEEYAGVPSLLLTTFLGDPHGVHGLPGGGVDEGEDPVDAVVREVWEETGQQVEVVQALAVHTDHFTGGSPAGAWEDYHAVRLIYRARCPRPVPTVVHDVGGTTADASWVPRAEVRRLPMTPTTFRDLRHLP